jgi:hypothetical protein
VGNRNKGDRLSYESPAVVAPTSAELTHLTHTLARRVGRFLERLCRYIARPAVSEKRLSLTPYGNVRYQLKTPYRESLPRERSECFGHGTTHVIFEPLDFIARLAALVPKPRVNLTRFHGVFAPNSAQRRRSSRQWMANYRWIRAKRAFILPSVAGCSGHPGRA